jgi:hypothetical protein
MIKKYFSRSTVTLDSARFTQRASFPLRLGGEGGLRGMTLRLVYHNQLFSFYRDSRLRSIHSMGMFPPPPRRRRGIKGDDVTTCLSQSAFLVRSAAAEADSHSKLCPLDKLMRASRDAFEKLNRS